MHDEYTWLMSLALDDEVTADEQQRLREHLRACASCAGIWQRWQEMDRRLSAAPAVVAPAGLGATIMARLSDGELVRRRRAKFALWFGLAIAAAIVVSAAGTAVALNWPLALPDSGALSAAISGLTSVGELLFRSLAEMVATNGLPAVAAGAGALLCLTCGLGIAWLWIVGQGSRGPEKTAVIA